MVGADINMQKELIKTRFAKSLTSYEVCAIVQKDMAKKLEGELSKKVYDNILELGCGTGFLTKEIIKNIRFYKYTAVDIVGNCGKYIHKISDKINFVETDIENYTPNLTPNLVVSNASVQWIEDLPTLIRKIYNYLSPNGEFVFSIFGKENYKELSQFIKTPLKYYDIDELKNICKDFKIINIKDEIKILEFNSPIEVLHHIKNTGVNALSQTTWTKSDLVNFKTSYPTNNNGNYCLTYHPIYISLCKL